MSVVKLRRKQINAKSGRCVELVAPAMLSERLIFFPSDEEADRYDADPDAWAARHFGLTLEQYREWIETEMEIY